MDKNRKLRYRIISVVLALTMIVPTLSAATIKAESGTAAPDVFRERYTYSPQEYTDVLPYDWFAENVKTAFEYGLMFGVGDGMFLPNGKLSAAEAITLACRLHIAYRGEENTFVQGTPWYQVYVDYAEENGLLPAGLGADLTAPATRAQFVTIVFSAVPASVTEPRTNVVSIPDVPAGAAYAAVVTRLYRAGILRGRDASGTFDPDATITRAEVAAIITRLVCPELRVNPAPAQNPTPPAEEPQPQNPTPPAEEPQPQNPTPPAPETPADENGGDPPVNTGDGSIELPLVPFTGGH